jgi:transmembrane sensor
LEHEDPITDAARRWVIRMASGEMGPADQRQLAAWLEQDRRHRDAFEAENLLWHLSGSLRPGLLGEAAAAPGSLARGPVENRRWPSGLIRRAAAIAVLIAGAAYVFADDLIVMSQADARTAAGEQRRIELPDGSSALMNTASALAIDYSDRERRVRLLRGEAFFEVRPQAGRPFRVETDGGTAEAVGTAFAVRSIGGAMTVTVSHGKVAVHVPPSAGQGGAPTPILQANQGLALDAASKASTVQKVDADKSLAWRSGRIVFEGTPFAEAIAELDRYFPGRILTIGDTAAMSPVTGIVRADELSAGIRAIAAVEGLTVTELSRNLLLVLH